MSTILNNVTVEPDPTQQRILEKMTQLPAEALDELEGFATFLVARAQGGFYANTEPSAPGKELSTNENFLKALRLLSPKDAHLIDQYVLMRASSSLKWSYDDPKSLAVAMDLMANDPFLRKEMEAINREFKCADSDGLEPY
jgi:hypothetical protein